ERLARKIDESRTSWLLPGLSEGFGGGIDAPARPSTISIAATDGSQIFPDRHEISACFLINIGYILLHYGTGEKPLMSSKPRLYYREEEIYEEWGGARVFVNRELVGFKRGLMEFTELADLALAAHAEGHRTLALADGTLILWNLEGKPQDFRAAHLEATLAAMDELREARVPVAGYISQPGSQELINALKLGLCPLEAADCDRCPYQEENQLHFSREEIDALNGDLWQGRGLPCSPIEGLNDAVLVRRVLRPGQRTPLYRSASKVLAEYGPHHICYFYLHVGTEIGRVEVPEWVATDRELLDLVHACLCDQAEKGQGYPVALAEAHERAVVRSADREAFYRFLRDTFVKNDLQTRLSTKSFKKRYTGI
ncbi:MAG: DNA double-strand break repair nuclease NurA, partial [Gemmatimonadota bacterium]|nr:DNA double-strand break repair nuclease NurA [Gemmatimonadota bacterium]